VRVCLSAIARTDLRSIGRYGARQWGRDRARRYAETIRDQFELLSRYPEIGVVADKLPGIRLRPVGSHVIYYRLDAEEVLVLRVLHASQDVERHIDE
jgi:toxin ParE1/3/4